MPRKREKSSDSSSGSGSSGSSSSSGSRRSYSRSRSPPRRSRSRSATRSPNKKVKRLERKLIRLEEKVQNKPAEKKFKFNSNRDQFDLNAGILEDLRVAKKNTKSARARRRIKRCMKKLRRRNKHIRIADSAKSGWKAVELYETDEVASDPEDDKRIKRCDKRALEIMKEDRDRNYSHTNEAGPSSRFRNASRSERSPKSDDRCFRCGKYSHWGEDCPTYGSSRSSRFDRSGRV